MNKFNANFGITPKNNSNFSNSFKPSMGGIGNLGQMNKGIVQNKYSFSELEDAKNAVKGLGGLKNFQGIGSNIDNSGGGNINSNVLNTGGNNNSGGNNYRKAFKPNFNGNGNFNTNNTGSLNNNNNLNNIYSNTMNTGNKTIKSNVMQQENFLVEKKSKNIDRHDNNQHHPNLLGIGNNNKPMLNSKYGGGMGNTNTSNSIGKQGGGSYTNSKLYGNKFTNDFNNFNKKQNDVNNFQNKKNNMNSNYMQQEDMYGGKSKNNYRNNDYNYMNSTQNVNSNVNPNMVKQNMNRTGFIDVDNMVAQNTQR